MSVFKYLSEEHALLLDLVGRLERANDEKETQKILLILLAALEAHEQLEHLVFNDEPRLPGKNTAALDLVARQHAALATLRDEARLLLRALPRESAATVRPLCRRLALLLRRHFKDEESILWPDFHARVGRSRLHHLERQARTQLKAMRKELDGYWTAVEHYL